MKEARSRRVWIGVGSNLEPLDHLQLASAVLQERYGRLELSCVYQNPPVGFAGADFLNMVVGLATAQPLQQVVALLDEIHGRVGRVSGEQKFGPRKLDLDLLLFGSLVDPLLRVPRADVLRYAFVLGPLAEVAPDLRHPVTGVELGTAWAAFAGARELRNLGSLASLNGTRITGAAAKHR